MILSFMAVGVSEKEVILGRQRETLQISLPGGR
jgi:hypothetical protein